MLARPTTTSSSAASTTSAVTCVALRITSADAARIAASSCSGVSPRRTSTSRPAAPHGVESAVGELLADEHAPITGFIVGAPRPAWGTASRRPRLFCGPGVLPGTIDPISSRAAWRSGPTPSASAPSRRESAKLSRGAARCPERLAGDDRDAVLPRGSARTARACSWACARRCSRPSTPSNEGKQYKAPPGSRQVTPGILHEQFVHHPAAVDRTRRVSPPLRRGHPTPRRARRAG